MTFRDWRLCGGAVLLLFLLAGGTTAQTVATRDAPASTATPDVIPIPAEALASSHFNAEAATGAYLAEMPAEARARSDAYFEGGYWLILWDFLAGVAVCLLLLNLRWSARMRDWAERVTRFKPVHTFVYWCEYLLLISILTFPLGLYEATRVNTNTVWRRKRLARG